MTIHIDFTFLTLDRWCFHIFLKCAFLQGRRNNNYNLTSENESTGVSFGYTGMTLRFCEWGECDRFQMYFLTNNSWSSRALFRYKAQDKFQLRANGNHFIIPHTYIHFGIGLSWACNLVFTTSRGVTKRQDINNKPISLQRLNAGFKRHLQYLRQVLKSFKAYPELFLQSQFFHSYS